jgi:type II secretion system protein D
LIAVGAEVYLGMVEDYVLILDSQEAEGRVTEVYNAKFRDGNDLQKAIQGFISQELDVLGEGDDEESRMRRMERQVSVEAIGDDEEGSSSLLIGTSPRAYQRTMEMIHSLDRPEPQVMISVLIAEVSLTDDLDLGVEIAGQQLNFTENSTVGPNGVIKGSQFDWVTGSDLGAIGLGLGGFNFTVTGEDFAFLFRALQANSRLEVLSRPVLMVRNGDEGKITIADQVPIVESSQINDTGSTNSSIGREDVGIVLTATPHISPDGYVTIALVQEISNIGESIQLTEGVASPIFATREVETNVTVRDGETVVIGGLIQSIDASSENKIPILGDLPWIGWLFRTTSRSTRKTELLVVLTVDILRTDEDVYDMSIEQRDKFVLPDSIRRSPLMEGLRITPDETVLGPKPNQTPAERLTPVRPDDALPPNRKQFGPRPRTYGPTIGKPSSISTVSARVYGPQIARSDTPSE